MWSQVRLPAVFTDAQDARSSVGFAKLLLTDQLPFARKLDLEAAMRSEQFKDVDGPEAGDTL